MHKRIFKDFFTFRPNAKSRQRRWLDAHNVLSVLPLIFHFMIVLTGLAYFCYGYIPSSIATLYKGSEKPFQAEAGLGGASTEFGNLLRMAPGVSAPNVPLASLLNRAKIELAPQPLGIIFVRDPGRANAVVEMAASNNLDHSHQLYFSAAPSIAFEGATGQVVRVVHGRPLVQTIIDTGAALHMAWFGGTPMRMLYLVCGLTGAVMMATGQLLFTIKRREQNVSVAAERFFKLVDRINVATIAGVCFACIAHLWAIRLLPYQITDRPGWEVSVFWLAWLLTFVHAALRAQRAAWIEQLSATAFLCVTLPLAGFMVPNSNFVEMIAKGDWRTAGIDLGSFAFGIIFACVAWTLSGKRAPMRNPSLQGA